MLYAYKYTLPCLYVLTVLMLLIYWWCGDTAARRQRLRRKHGSGRNRWYFRNSFTRRVYKSSWVYFNKNALKACSLFLATLTTDVASDFFSNLIESSIKVEALNGEVGSKMVTISGV